MSNATTKTVIPLENSTTTSKSIGLGVAKGELTVSALISTDNAEIGALFAMRAQAMRGVGDGLDLRRLIDEGRD